MSQPTMTVEIDDAIRRDPELLRDVEAATAYLDTLRDLTEPPAVARWSIARVQPERTNERPAVTLTLLDRPDYDSGVAVTAPITRHRMHSRDFREQVVNWVWRNLLRDRSKVLHERVTLILTHGDWGDDDGDQ